MMTPEQKELLILDLSRRLTHKPEVEICDGLRGRLREIDVTGEIVCIEILGNKIPRIVRLEDIKPILRPLETMTTKEREGFGNTIKNNRLSPYGEVKDSGVDNLLLSVTKGADVIIRWMISMEFDYLGLLKEGLAKEKEVGS